MPTPSLILVPARFKTGKLYTPVATTSGGTVLGASGDFNVTRATTATRVNASGNIEVVASGIPRLDYFASGGTAGCPALLVEPSGSNLARQSEDFTTTWTAVNTTPTANQTTSPDNTLTADRISITSNGGYIRQVIATSNSTTYTASCFVKNDTVASGDTFRFYFNNNNPSPNAAQALAIININAGTVTTSSGGGGISAISTGIENYGNGWYRVRVTFTLGASAGSAGSEIGFDAPTATRTFFAWGAQFETGSVATSYIPTTTAAVTRNADVISVSGAVSGCIGQTEGTIYAEFRYLGTPIVRAGFVYLRQTGFRGLSINFAPSDIPSGILFISRNASGTTSIQLTNGLTLGAYYKIAIAYDAGGTAAGGTQASGVTAYVNGSPATVSVGSLRVPDTSLNEFRLYGANSGDENEVPNGNLRAVALYTTRLTNAQLAALTTP